MDANILNSWLECYNNINFLSLNVKEIHLPNDPIKHNCNMKKSYFIEDANTITIHVDDKINHLILNRCDTINLIINVDLISGLEIFHSNNINIIYAHTASSIVASINFGTSYHISILNSRTINCMMCTICVNDMYFIINDTTYKVHENLFRGNPLYFFIEKTDGDGDGDGDGDEKNITINTIDSIYGMVCSKTL